LLRRLPTFDPPEAALKQRRSLQRSLGRTRCETLGVVDSRYAGVEFAAFPLSTTTTQVVTTTTTKVAFNRLKISTRSVFYRSAWAHSSVPATTLFATTVRHHPTGISTTRY
jgi:hypothetical protein